MTTKFLRIQPLKSLVIPLTIQFTFIHSFHSQNQSKHYPTVLQIPNNLLNNNDILRGQQHRDISFISICREPITPYWSKSESLVSLLFNTNSIYRVGRNLQTKWVLCTSLCVKLQSLVECMYLYVHYYQIDMCDD